MADERQVDASSLIALLAAHGRVSVANIAEWPPSASALLEAMVDAGLLTRDESSLQLCAGPELMVGRVRCSAAGRLSLVPFWPAGTDEQPLGADHTQSVAHGDIVVARRAGRGRAPAAITGVVLRAAPTVVGVVHERGVHRIVVPVDARYVHDVQLARDGPGAEGEVVMAAIERPAGSGHPAVARVVEVMGREGDPSLDGEMVVRLHGLPCQFSAVVLAEARRCTGAIRTSDLQGRLDLRDVATITIDPEDAQDFDDAISLECIDGGYRLGVHIADVAHYVAEGSALDAEAMRRGTSVYLPGLCVPMLPHELSEHACSLRPHVDRLALSVLIDLDCDGAVRDAQMARSVVHSDARLTYAEALDACEGGSDALSSPLQEMLATMAAVARTLLARRDAAGAIDFDLPEAKVTFDDTGRVSAVTRSERTFAHRLIEQFMVLANEVVARYLTTAGLPMIYRIHERPDPDKVANFAAVALAYGHAFNTRAAEPAEFQRLLRRLAGRAEERMLSYLMLRTLRTARYATSNSGHFGLATDCYTHFTSPIRRYPDLVVHRLLRAALDATPSPPNPSGAVKLEGRVFDPAARSRVRERLDHVAALASDRERAADDAASEAVAWKRAELLSSMLGDECDAVITRLFPYGLLVELADVYAEGFLAVEALGNEEFRLTEVGDALIGRSTRTAFRLGDQLHVRIDRVDRRQQWFDASLV